MSLFQMSMDCQRPSAPHSLNKHMRKKSFLQNALPSWGRGLWSLVCPGCVGLGTAAGPAFVGHQGHDLVGGGLFSVLLLGLFGLATLPPHGDTESEPHIHVHTRPQWAPDKQRKTDAHRTFS